MFMDDPTVEKDIQKAAIKHAESRKVQVIRMVFRPGLRAGWPDVLFLIPGGRPLFIEFKSKGKKPTCLQAKRLRELVQAGYHAVWADNLPDAVDVIERVLDDASSR